MLFAKTTLKKDLRKVARVLNRTLNYVCERERRAAAGTNDRRNWVDALKVCSRNGRTLHVYFAHLRTLKLSLTKISQVHCGFNNRSTSQERLDNDRSLQIRSNQLRPRQVCSSDNCTTKIRFEQRYTLKIGFVEIRSPELHTFHIAVD